MWCDIAMSSHSNGIFKTVKALPFPDVAARYGHQPDRGNKIPCPFHKEGRNPNFHVYSDGGHCYSCQWHGDSVKFVADLYGLRPLNAARLIAGDFSLATVDRSYRPRRNLAPEVAERRRKWNERARHQLKVDIAERFLCLVIRIIDHRLRTPEDLERFGDLARVLGESEIVLDMLANRDEQVQNEGLAAFEGRWVV